MTQDLQKSLKKGTFYEELFKTISSNNKNYQICKALFQPLRKKSKNLRYAKRLSNCENNVTKTWDTTKPVTCNRLYNYFSLNNLFFEKIFGLQVTHLIEHTILQPVSQILDSFNEH